VVTINCDDIRGSQYGTGFGVNDFAYGELNYPKEPTKCRFKQIQEQMIMFK